MRRFIEIILQKAGFEVIAAEDGLAAMQIALETEIDAVVADAIMPNMTGYDLVPDAAQNPAKEIPLHNFKRSRSKTTRTTNLADVYLIKGHKSQRRTFRRLSKTSLSSTFFAGKSIRASSPKIKIPRNRKPDRSSQKSAREQKFAKILRA